MHFQCVPLIFTLAKNSVTMGVGRLTSDDRSLIWNLQTQKGWGSWRMMKEFPNKSCDGIFSETKDWLVDYYHTLCTTVKHSCG